MSHQTGIKANADLLKYFGKCKDGKIRLLKISIINEQLALVDHRDVKKDWEKDFDVYVKPIIEPNTPCYILYRLDEKTAMNYGWMLISWTPDSATIRQKMLYASTKATLKQEFGSAHIVEEFHATSLDEANLEGWKRHKRAFSAPAPLTTREEELQELRRSEVKTDYSTETRQQTLGGISCPLTESAAVALRDLSRGSYNYLQFRIELAEEMIHLVKAGNINVSQLPSQVPSDQARYHIFLFKHTHEGDYMESYVFIYSMPGYACSVKERMIYSSCKQPFVQTILGNGIEIEKRIEIDEGAELTEEFLQDQLHPKKILHRPQFSKPKGPPNRGAKRLTKPQTDM